MVLMSVYTWDALFSPGGPYYVIVNSNWSPTSPALYGLGEKSFVMLHPDSPSNLPPKLVAVIVHMFFAWYVAPSVLEPSILMEEFRKIKALGQNRWVKLLLPCIIFVVSAVALSCVFLCSPLFSVDHHTICGVHRDYSARELVSSTDITTLRL